MTFSEIIQALRQKDERVTNCCYPFKMRKLLTLLLLLVGTALTAQEIEIQSFEPTLDISAKINPIYDANGDAGALIRISIASDNASFSGNIIGEPLRDHGDWLVYVPTGSQFLRISVDGYASVNFDFPIRIESFRTYELRINLPSREKANTLILPTYSISNVHSSYGLMIGYVNRFGGYFRVKSDFNFGLSTIGDCDDKGRDGLSSLWLTGEDTKKSRLAITAGAMFRIGRPIYAYIGAGYGYRTLAWQNYDGTYYKVTPSSFSGIEAETGLLARLGVIALSAGVQTNQFKFVEANLGIGLMF